MTDYEGYCVKCRAKRTFPGTIVALKNGRRAAKGICPVCGTKMNRILGKDDPGEPVTDVTGSVAVVTPGDPPTGSTPAIES